MRLASINCTVATVESSRSKKYFCRKEQKKKKKKKKEKNEVASWFLVLFLLESSVFTFILSGTSKCKIAAPTDVNMA